MMMKNTGSPETAYVESCRKAFWKKVFQLELEYLIDRLKGYREVLSVGCGPAIVEDELCRHGYSLTGLDVSQEALGCAPESIRAVSGRAEDLPFPENAFDAVIFIASLQFIQDYEKAVDEAARVLRPTGRLIAMLLNPESVFFKSKIADPSSYVRKIRHTELGGVEETVSKRFQVATEYLLGVKDGAVFQSRDPAEAVLYVIEGVVR